MITKDHFQKVLEALDFMRNLAGIWMKLFAYEKLDFFPYTEGDQTCQYLCCGAKKYRIFVSPLVKQNRVVVEVEKGDAVIAVVFTRKRMILEQWFGVVDQKAKGFA